VDRLLASDSALGRGLAHQKSLLEKQGVACEVMLRYGMVMPELLEELRHNEYQLVVAGSSPAHVPLSGYVMDNVTREIVNRAELPVLVVRAKKTISHRFGYFVGRLFEHSKQATKPGAAKS